MSEMNFKELGLNEDVLKAIDDMGFEEPSKIQEKVIPVLLQGFDVIGQAQTGTGKTLAFGAPVLNNITFGNKNTKCLVLAPTRELAIQVNEELVRIAKHTRARILPVYGGQSIDRQIKALNRGIDIIVGTPGRVLDLMRRNVINLRNIDFLVMDEADEMLNMGFIDDIEEILKGTNPERQTLLFSATMPAEIKKLAKNYMKDDAQHISIIKNEMTVSTVSQYYYEVKHSDRVESLCRILDVDSPTAAIIFCKTKKGVDELVSSMQARGYSVEGMHGDLTQNHRMNTLRKFKEGHLEFLVATDVAARGIDVENVTHVINYDLPQDTESYVHRIGRTGRANREGVAYTLVTPREYRALKQIERATKGKIKRKEIPTIDDIFEAKYNTIYTKVKETIEGEDFSKFIPLAEQIDAEFDLVDVAAALMNMIYSKEVSYDSSENSISVKSSGGYERLFINLGRKDGMNPKSLLAFLSEGARFRKEDIGDIDIFDKYTFIDASEDAARHIMKNTIGKRVRGRKVNIEIANSRK
ncbi:DEAD/DEAH box helicase [Clostridium paridis]|uniref:ATP-dependent RNA helicase CshA n=1 Tax=Clostridium paridis TaxID=2803863 RepID=A0A937K409_9CLOT|nr:DEAD/DEAH box helicase [Clostridium paridis]MBL4931364.1 DEAD/DEAH box helicase [Clostridium paridis]